MAGKSFRAEMERKKVGYEDVVMSDVQTEEEEAAEVMSQLSLSENHRLSGRARAPGRGRVLAVAKGARFANNKVKVASEALHRRVKLHDVDNMADDRRGGGGYNRKRRFNRDDDEGGYERRPQRRRYEDAPPGTRLRRQLVAVAESPMRKPEDEVQDIAKLVTENYHDNYVKETYCDLVLSLVVEQPFKIPFVAASVLCANRDKSEAGAEVLSRTAVLLQRHLDGGNWREVKLLVRFLGCLQPLFSDDGVFSVLDELFNRAVDLQTASSDDAVGLELVKIILLTIPYVLASPKTGLEQRAAEMLEKTDIVASTPHALEALVDAYPAPDTEQRPMQGISVLNALQRQLQSEAASGWTLGCIPRLVRAASDDDDDDDDDAMTDAADEQKTKHAFPQINVPSPVNPGPKPLFPELYFSLFADQDVESVPSTSDVAASLLRDAVTDTINILDFNRNAAAKFLIDLDCYWAPNTFVKRATPFDKLKDIPDGRSTWKPEDLVVDAVFSQIFQLPAPEHKLVYYHSVITEACKIAPAAVAPSLGRAIRFLFRNVDVMDLELQYRYMDWFAHHLSNFEFRWKWAEWIDELDRSNLEPKKAFIVGSLDKEIRLSFAKRIRETLPEQYAPLISEGKLKDTPDFKYADEQTPYAQQANQIHALIRKKGAEEDIQKFIDEIQALASEHGVQDVLVPSTDAYVTSVCAVGSKSLSHVLSCIERCKDRLLAIGPQSELARRQIITSVIGYWAHHPGTAVNIIDKLLNYTIITPMSVIEWALHDHMDHGRALAQIHIFEMISATMFKVSNRMRQIVRARAETNLSDEQKGLLDETLVRERQSMRDLFNAIIDAVSTVAAAAQDDMIERFDGDSTEQTLLQQWGSRWARVWRRKLAVEEAIVGEAAIEAADAAGEAERAKLESQAANAPAAAAAQEPPAAPAEPEDHDVA